MSKMFQCFIGLGLVGVLSGCPSDSDSDKKNCVEVTATLSALGDEAVEFQVSGNGYLKTSDDIQLTPGLRSFVSSWDSGPNHNFKDVTAGGQYTAGIRLLQFDPFGGGWVPLTGWDAFKTWSFQHNPSDNGCTVTNYSNTVSVGPFNQVTEKPLILGPSGTTPPPTVVSGQSPADGSAENPVQIWISAFPSRPLDCATVSADQVGLAVAATGASVAGHTECLEQELRFVPDLQLEYSTTYQAAVKAGALDVTGLEVTPAQWTFSTFARPVVVAANPPNGAQDISPNTGISVSFSKPMSCASIYGHTTLNGYPLPPSVSCSGSTLSYPGPLQETTGYTIQFNDGVLGGDGSELVPWTYSFSTMLCPRVHAPGCWSSFFGHEFCTCWSGCWVPACP